MKKILCLIIGILMITSTGWAVELVSDQTPVADEVTMFKLFFNANPSIDSVPVDRAIKYNLDSLPDGAYTVKAQACNVWGCSADSAPLVFTKKVPSAPVLLRLVK